MIPSKGGEEGRRRVTYGWEGREGKEKKIFIYATNLKKS